MEDIPHQSPERRPIQENLDTSSWETLAQLIDRVGHESVLNALNKLVADAEVLSTEQAKTQSSFESDGKKDDSSSLFRRMGERVMSLDLPHSRFRKGSQSNPKSTKRKQSHESLAKDDGKFPMTAKLANGHKTIYLDVDPQYIEILKDRYGQTDHYEMTYAYDALIEATVQYWVNLKGDEHVPESDKAIELEVAEKIYHKTTDLSFESRRNPDYLPHGPGEIVVPSVLMG